MASFPLQISGVVQRGNGDAGRLFNFPTANLYLSASPLEPGIYAGRTEAGSHVYDSVICFGVEEGKLESHLFDFSGDLYEKRITVKVLERVGDIIPWESVAQMKKVIYENAKKARAKLKA
jgi:riboflavin kinase / FMN adenylyltransferase